MGGKVRKEGSRKQGGEDLGDGEHPAEEEPGEDIVMIGVLPEPDLDLDEVVLGGGVAGGKGGGGG